MTADEMARELLKLKRAGNLTLKTAKPLVDRTIAEQDRISRLVEIRAIANRLVSACEYGIRSTEDEAIAWCAKEVIEVLKELAGKVTT